MEVKLKPCTYRSFGCPVKLSEDLLDKHLEEDVETHLSLVTKALKLERSQKEFQKEALQVATRRCREADGENMQLRRQLQALELFEQLAKGSIDESKLSKKFSSDDTKSENKEEDNITAASRKLQSLLREHKDISDEVKKLKMQLAQTSEVTEVREVPEVCHLWITCKLCLIATPRVGSLSRWHSEPFTHACFWNLWNRYPNPALHDPGREADAKQKASRS